MKICYIVVSAFLIIFYPRQLTHLMCFGRHRDKNIVKSKAAYWGIYLFWTIIFLIGCLMMGSAMKVNSTMDKLVYYFILGSDNRDCVELGSEENDEAYRLMEDREGLGPVSKPQKVKTAEPKPRKRATVTISAAALAVGCSESCIKKWERGESMPNGYPGRDDLVALHMFAAKYKAQKAANRTSRNMRRASTGYDIDSYGESYETDT